MKIIKYSDTDFEKVIDEIINRKAFSQEVSDTANEIIKEVKANGNEALLKFALKIDKVKLTEQKLRINRDEIDEAEKTVSRKTRDSIKYAIGNISEYARKQRPKDWSYSPRKGVTTGEKFFPLNRIGVYIPGGTAPLVSTAIHTISIAKASGVKEIVAITPPGKGGTVNRDLLYAMNTAGATEIFRIGGVYGIAALAYGTETIKKVEKIVGPGNAYVTAAKKHVYGEVAIDMIAGPSEIMVVADENNDPDFAAADILSQAEHGSGNEQAVLVSTSRKFIKQVESAITAQAKNLSRTEAIEKVLEKGVFLIEAKTIDQIADIVNRYAPEHLEIMIRNADLLCEKINAAGAIFVGEYTPEPVGDFVAGPSHVLPTGGSAKYFSGITADTFYRRSSLIKYTKEALENEYSAIKHFASMEGLDAHGNSVSVRFKNQG